MQYDVIIIGGGHNGLTCAAYLGMAGLRVKVLERRGVVGGAAVTEEFHPGFRNSTAAYTVSLLNPKVIRDLDLHRHGLRIVERRALNFLPTPDDRYLLVGEGRTNNEIAKFSARDAARHDAFSAQLHAISEVLRDMVLKAPPNVVEGGSLRGLLELAKAAALGRRLGRLDMSERRALLDLFAQSAADYLDGWFESEPVKALYAFDAVVGNFASPYTPATAYVLLHHAFGEVNGKKGIWGHAIGGMGAITQAMAKAAREHGADIETGAEVREVVIERDRATGRGAKRRPRGARPCRRGQCEPEAVLRQHGRARRFARGVRRPHAALQVRLRHLPHECRAVCVAELHGAAGRHRAGSPHRRHHSCAQHGLYGPRLSRRPHAWLEPRTHCRDADPLDARRQPGAARRPCREPVLPTCRRRNCPTAHPGTITASASPT